MGDPSLTSILCLSCVFAFQFHLAVIFHLVSSHCIDTCVLPSSTWYVLDPGGDIKAKLFVVSFVSIHLRRHPACCYKGRD